MTDIVEKLRQPCHPDEPPSGVDLERREAAEEIERLRAALRKLIEACEDETAKIPYKDGDDELQRAKTVLGDN